MMFKHFGVDAEKEIKVVALGPAAARLSALKEGLVEAAVISPPADEEARKLGFKISREPTSFCISFCRIRDA